MITTTVTKLLGVTLMLIAFAIFSSTLVFAAPKWPIPEGIKTIEVNGYDLAYQDAGSGTPLVLVHGTTQDYRTWDILVPEISKTYRTIAVSLRHYYPEKWDGVGDDFSVAQHASDIAVLIKKLNLGKVHLLGISRGGSIALTVALLNPELIRSVILQEANAEPIMPDTPEKKQRMAKAKARAESVRAALAKGDREGAAREFLAADGVDWKKFPARPWQITLENIGTCVDSGERGIFSCADIQRLDFPILLLSGEKSPKIYGEYNAALRGCKPDIPAPVIIPNGVHLTMHRNNPEFYHKVLSDFLNKH